MATYENVYSIKNIHAGSIDALTLYEANKALTAMAKAGDITTDSNAVIACKGRPVAFWCHWRGTVRPAYAAHDQERSVLDAWN